MTNDEKKKALEHLNRYAGMRIVQIEQQCHDHGLTGITNFTLIARDPNNDNMCFVVTNEDDGLDSAMRVALKNASIVVAG